MLSRALVVSALIVCSTSAWSEVVTFENFADGDVITSQIADLTFSNTEVLTAGFSLNEFDFPPHSGANVVFDNGGPITIVFSKPVSSFEAFFTYTERLNLLGFDSTNTEVAGAVSLFLNNTGTGGDPGSSPNELLEIGVPGGLSSVEIAGDPLGGSFTIDDVTYAFVPEPGSWAPLMALLGAAMVLRHRRQLNS